jgi:L-fuculose-phosphate aldolase
MARYRDERDLIVETISDLLAHGHLDCNGGAIAVRLPDGNMIMTPTGAAVRRWKVDPGDLVAMTMNGEVVEGGAWPSAASTVQCLMLLRAFPGAGAVIHTHARGSLTFAALGQAIPAAVTSRDKLGEIPCIRCDDQDVKQRYLASPWPVEVPGAMDAARPDVAAVGAQTAAEAIALLLPRAGALASRSLAFTMYRHGLVVLAASLQRAVQDLTSIEANAHIAYRAALLAAAGQAAASLASAA